MIIDYSQQLEEIIVSLDGIARALQDITAVLESDPLLVKLHPDAIKAIEDILDGWRHGG